MKYNKTYVYKYIKFLKFIKCDINGVVVDLGVGVGFF
jgi:hypothetical protein